VDTYKTEQEQLEALKRWWETNGKFVLVVLVIAFTTTIGWRVWSNHENSTLESASLEYNELIGKLRSEESDAALRHGADLIEKRGDTSYAVLAALAMAKLEVEKDELDTARQRLTWAVEHAEIPEIVHIARIRLARVLLALGKFDEALAQASVDNTDGFDAAYEMVKGDIYAQRGLADQAKTAYNTALNTSFDMNATSKNMLQMKLDNLGGANLSVSTE